MPTLNENICYKPLPEAYNPDSIDAMLGRIRDNIINDVASEITDANENHACYAIAAQKGFGIQEHERDTQYLNRVSSDSQKILEDTLREAFNAAYTPLRIWQQLQVMIADDLRRKYGYEGLKEQGYSPEQYGKIVAALKEMLECELDEQYALLSNNENIVVDINWLAIDKYLFERLKFKEYLIFSPQEYEFFKELYALQDSNLAILLQESEYFELVLQMDLQPRFFEYISERNKQILTFKSADISELTLQELTCDFDRLEKNFFKEFPQHKDTYIKHCWETWLSLSHHDEEIKKALDEEDINFINILLKHMSSFPKQAQEKIVSGKNNADANLLMLAVLHDKQVNIQPLLSIIDTFSDDIKEKIFFDAFFIAARSWPEAMGSVFNKITEPPENMQESILVGEKVFEDGIRQTAWWALGSSGDINNSRDSRDIRQDALETIILKMPENLLKAVIPLWWQGMYNILDFYWEEIERSEVWKRVEVEARILDLPLKAQFEIFISISPSFWQYTSNEFQRQFINKVFDHIDNDGDIIDKKFKSILCSSSYGVNDLSLIIKSYADVESQLPSECSMFYKIIKFYEELNYQYGKLYGAFNRLRFSWDMDGRMTMFKEFKDFLEQECLNQLADNNKKALQCINYYLLKIVNILAFVRNGHIPTDSKTLARLLESTVKLDEEKSSLQDIWHVLKQVVNYYSLINLLYTDTNDSISSLPEISQEIQLKENNPNFKYYLSDIKYNWSLILGCALGITAIALLATGVVGTSFIGLLLFAVVLPPFISFIRKICNSEDGTYYLMKWAHEENKNEHYNTKEIARIIVPGKQEIMSATAEQSSNDTNMSPASHEEEVESSRGAKNDDMKVDSHSETSKLFPSNGQDKTHCPKSAYYLVPFGIFKVRGDGYKKGALPSSEQNEDSEINLLSITAG